MRKWLTVAAAALGICGSAGASSLDPAHIAGLFTQANELFRQANEQAAANSDNSRDLYRKSLMRLERLAREGGIRNGRLYYNVGNAYFRLKDIGRAILNYRRAQHFIPNDANLVQNLHYARTKRADQIEERQQARVLRTLFFWHYDLSGQTRSFVFALSFAILWVLATVRLFARRYGPAWGLLVSGTVAALCLASLVIDARAQASWQPGVIVSAEVVARKGDSDTYEPSYRDPLHTGTEFRMLENRSGWYHIELADGRTCWIPSHSAEMLWQELL